MMADIGREIIEIVEIDVDYCARVWGEGLCGASLDTAQTRTNVFLRAQEFDNAYWTKTNVSVTGGYNAPDGTQTAWRAYDSVTNARHRINRISVPVTSGQTYTLSCFVKAGTYSRAALQMGVSGTAFPTDANWRASFDLSSGAVLSQGSSLSNARITPDINGWWRISITGTAVATSSETINPVYLVNNSGAFFFAGTGSDYILAWGAQFEVGANPSGYKATTTATVSALHGGSAHKCHNGYATCAYRQAFDKTTKTLRYGSNVSGLPVDQAHIFSALRSVSSRAAEINLSGVDPQSTALGKRARVSITLDDFTDTDLTLDKYAAERVTGAAQADGIGYRPQDRGTHFRKMRVRFPYYNARALRTLSGYAGDALSSYTTRHYVMSEWAGPDSAGRVKITAKDIFDIADTDKSVLPALSRGKLAADIGSTVGATLTLEPATVGEEYQSSGRVCIGGEVARFTRSGDVLTLTARGVDGTSAENHDAGDLVQECYRITDTPLAEAIHDVLTNTRGTNPIPLSQIDIAEWQDEAAGWLSGVNVSATVTEPIERKRLVGELCQLGALVWPDEVAQKIRFRANRPIAPGETAYPLTDDGSFVERTSMVSDDEDERISRVFFWHGMRDPTGSVSGASNMNRGAVGWNAEAEGDLEYGETRLQQISTRWLGREGNDAVAATVAERLASRYRDTPRTFEGQIDDRDARNLSLGDICLVTTPLVLDAVGLPLPTLMQVRYIEHVVPGHRAKIKLQTFTFDGRFAFWMTSGDPDYDAASEAELTEGAYWIDEAEADFGDGRGPYVWF